MDVELDKLQERKAGDLVMNDVGLNGDIAMRVSRALRLPHTNKVRGPHTWNLAVTPRRCSRRVAPQHLAKKMISVALQSGNVDDFKVCR